MNASRTICFNPSRARRSAPWSRFYSCLTVPILLFGGATWVLPVQATRAHGSEIAYFRANNVSLMNATGGGSHFITTRGTGYGAAMSITYPAYSWSPDGRYLLLAKYTQSGGRQSDAQMLLADAHGTIIRSLGATVFPADFDPHWALDSDRVAYVARQQFASKSRGFRQTIDSVDLQGHARFLADYYSYEGCGGGTGDPAAIVWWRETGFGGVRTTLLWSTKRHLLIHSGDCGSGLWLTDTMRHITRRLGSLTSPWEEAALSPIGSLAVTVRTNSPHLIDITRVALADPRTGRILRFLGPGELPVWSPDGTSLYYVRRTPGRMLRFAGSTGNGPGSQTFSSAIWRTDSLGNHAAQILHQDAYALGPLGTSTDGPALTFSRVDNAWTLWRLYRSGRRYTPAQVAQYGPKVRIERLVPGKGVTVLAWNAGRPAVQP